MNSVCKLISQTKLQQAQKATIKGQERGKQTKETNALELLNCEHKDNN